MFARFLFCAFAAVLMTLGAAVVEVADLDVGAVAVVATAKAAGFDNNREPGRYYDSLGRYKGRTDASGRSYDSLGRYQGRQDANGRFYDGQGRYQGRQDANGRFYDEAGRYQGRVDANGRY